MLSMRFSTTVLSWLLIGLSSVAVGQFKVACTCLPPPSPSDEFGVSRAVFSGRVIAIQVDTTQPFRLLRVTFQVNQRWKGVDSSQISIYTATSEASCGFSFHVDSTYLVYAYQSQYALMTNLCMRTRPLSRAAEDLAFLTTVSVENGQAGGTLPQTLELAQNYPNPANPETVFRFSLPRATRILLALYDVRGQRVRVLLDQNRSAGNYSLSVNLSGLASGTYVCRLDTDLGSRSKKFIVLR